jgi:alpha-beta hydrolase superfamily lysophospholipase
MKRRRPWLKWIGGLLALFVAMLALFRQFEHHQVYFPDRHFPMEASFLGRPWEEADFASTDGVRLNGWFFPADATARHKRLVVLVSHGNAGNISHRLGLAAALLETGVNVMLYDYRGFGRSEGKPSEEGTYLDAQAACTWLRRKGFAGTEIVAFGESLGGGVSSELALRETLGGLVLQSTFTSIPDIGAEFFPFLPVHLLATIKYETIRKLPRIQCPVLVMHSRDDELVRFAHSRRNFEAANPPKMFLELQGGHNDALSDRAGFVAGMTQFLSSLSQQN